MAHVVSVPPEPFFACDGALRVHCIPAATDNLCWVAECVETGEAVIVDGPPDPEMLAAIDALGLQLTGIWNTHTHYDHIGINGLLESEGRLAALTVAGPAGAKAAIPGLTQPVDDGDTVTVGRVTAKVWRTDGHQDGHVSYVLSDVLFCGDTLFAGGCGYLFDGPPKAMFSSLMRLAQLPGDTRVCCAHEYTEDNLRFAWSIEPGNTVLAKRIVDVWATRAEGRCTVPSTIEMERATNPFLRPGSAILVKSVGLEGEKTVPADVFTAARLLKNGGAYKAMTDADLPLGSVDVVAGEAG